LKLYSQRTEGWGVPRASGENYFGEWERDLLFATASWDKLTEDSSFVLSHPPQRNAHIAALRLADILFPAEVVKPGSASVTLATEALRECREAGVVAFKGVAPERVELTFQRIVMGLLLLDARRRLPPEAREAAGEMARSVGSLLKHPTPTFERRQMFLSLLGVAPRSSAEDLPKLALPPAMLKLDLSWLAEVTALLGGDRKRNAQLTKFISGVAKVVFRYVFNEGGKIRLLLGNIDERLTPTQFQGGIQIDIEWDSTSPAKLLQLLRGPDPEFRDPCRFALLEAFPDHSSRVELGAIFAEVVKLDLKDLEPETFAAALAPNAEHALESYVELVDRCWALGDLLKRARAARPEAAKLGRVAEAYQRWDEAVRLTLLNAFTTILKTRKK
jgi:hypothetical protein